ncbi:MAG: hypothetical protein ACEPOW_09160 [Bacteroidales bacterium]
MKKRLKLSVIFFLFFITTNVLLSKEKIKKDAFLTSIVPDYTRLQFAGQVGVLSLGLGYNHFEEQLKLEFFYGYLPRMHGYSDIHTLGIKSSLLFWKIPIRNFMFDEISPIFSVSVNLTVGDGRKTFWRVPSYFPDGYYSPNVIRFCPAIGVNFRKKIKPYTFVKEFDFYVEMVTNNVYFAYFVKNHEVDLNEIFSLTLGLRLKLW